MKLKELLESKGLLQIDLPFDVEERYQDEIDIVFSPSRSNYEANVRAYVPKLQEFLRKTYPSITCELLAVYGDEGVPDIRFTGTPRDMNKFIIDDYCGGDEEAADDFMDYWVKL